MSNSTENLFVNIDSDRRITRNSEWLLIIFFCAAITLPGAWALRGLGQVKVDVTEKRTLASTPRLELRRLRSFPAEVDAFFNDRIGLRRTFIQLHTWYLWQCGTSTNPTVLIGRDKWLFHNGAFDMDDFYGNHPIPATNLEGIKSGLQAKQKSLTKRGIKSLFFIAPNKQTIHPEYLPGAAIQRRSSRTNFDQLLEVMPPEVKRNFLDLRPPLQEAARREIVYYPQDTHWNDLGCRVACREILQRCRQLFPEVDFGPELEFSEEKVLSDAMCDLRSSLGLPPAMLERTNSIPIGRDELKYTISHLEKSPLAHPPRLRIFDNPRGHLRVILYGDSFLYGRLTDWTAQYFKTTWMLNKYDGYSEADLAKLIEQEKPDLVIEERVERNLHMGF